MCPGRPKQSDQDYPRCHYKCECEDNAHRGAQPPRNATPRREDGFVPSLLRTTIQPSEILHERFCPHKPRPATLSEKRTRFFFLSCNRMRHAPCDDLSRISAGPGWPAFGWRVDAPRALRGRATIPRARRRSVGRSCVACPGRPCGISAEKEKGNGRRCGSAITRGKGNGSEVSSGEWRTLMEVKESWMMPSNARQLLRPSWSFSCADGQQRSMP